MAKVVIGIHGLGNKPPKTTLEKWWKSAIGEGLARIGKHEFPFVFELVYWADILYEKPLDENVSDPDDPYYLKEKYVLSTENFVAEEHPNRKKILDFLTKQIDSLFLNDDYSLNYAFITDTILRHYFRDLDIYYKTDCINPNDFECTVKEKIRQRTADVISKYRKDEILVIGHSMGSIIGYDVLSFLIPQIKIDTFITIGSPLALPIIKSKIAAERNQKSNNTAQLKSPPIVKRKWYNFSDLEDKVAFNYNLADDFAENGHRIKPIDFVVSNDYQINGEKNPHKSYGYLRTPDFSDKLVEFLIYEKPGFWKNLSRFFLRFFNGK